MVTASVGRTESARLETVTGFIGEITCQAEPIYKTFLELFEKGMKTSNSPELNNFLRIRKQQAASLFFTQERTAKQNRVGPAGWHVTFQPIPHKHHRKEKN